jgi:integrase
MDTAYEKASAKAAWRLIPFLILCYFVAYLDRVNAGFAALTMNKELKAHPHMLRHACGYALANKGHDTRAIQAWLGHRSITSVFDCGKCWLSEIHAAGDMESVLTAISTGARRRGP